MECSQCDKEINCVKDVYVEFNEKMYHHKCFECKICNQNFDFVQTIPIIDQNGRLFCPNDFIQTLKCVLCEKNFDLKSIIFNLKEEEENSKPLLAHVECTKCSICNVNLKSDNEYVITKSFTNKSNLNESEKKELNCKTCFNTAQIKSNKVKCVKSINHRLSSRQKELLATKIISDKIDVEKEFMCEQTFDLLLDSLSCFVKCSKKSLSNYIVKHLNRTKNKSQTKSIELLLNDLKSLDKIIAPPNQCPFPQYVTTNKSDK